MFRLQGQAPRLRAAEINRWNKLADQEARGELLRPPIVNASNYDPSSRVVLCKNTSDEDRGRFECMALTGSLLFDPLETDGSVSVVFKLDTADPGKLPAILIEPIEAGGYGRAVIDGLALALVNAGSGICAIPQASSHKLEPGGGPIRLLSNPQEDAESLIPVYLDSNSSFLAKSPSGGIPAATGSGPYNWGNASCTVVDSDGTVGTERVDIYNIVDDTISGSVVLKANRVGDRYVVDVASC